MLSKYLDENRSMFVISFNDYEEIPELKETDKILELLTNKYSDKTMDLPPYHYAIINNKVIEIKDTELANTDTEYLSIFENDIRILIINSEFKEIESELASIIARTSVKYCMKISGNIIFDTEELSITNRLEILTKEAIQKRNELKSKFIIIEDIVVDKLIVSKDISIVSNRKSFISLRDFSEKYMVNLEILRCINPDVNPDKLSVNDCIFIPNTDAYKSVETLLRACKVAKYLTDKTTKIIRRAVDNE